MNTDPADMLLEMSVDDFETEMRDCLERLETGPESERGRVNEILGLFRENLESLVCGRARFLAARSSILESIAAAEMDLQNAIAGVIAVRGRLSAMATPENLTQTLERAREVEAITRMLKPLNRPGDVLVEQGAITDTDRLNWLDSDDDPALPDRYAAREFRHPEPPVWHVAHRNDRSWSGKTLREAIDSAMLSKPDPT